MKKPLIGLHVVMCYWNSIFVSWTFHQPSQVLDHSIWSLNAGISIEPCMASDNAENLNLHLIDQESNRK